MTSLRIAVAGAGLIGRKHIERIRQSAACELTSIVDPSPAARELAASLGVPLFDNLDQMAVASRPDGIILATPNALHVPGGLNCVQLGIPALVEKPIAESVDAATTLVEAAEKAGVPLLVGHHRRHSAILARARQQIDSGALGRLVAVSGSATFYKPDHYFDDGPWRRELGGGPILINMIHEVDDLRFLCGDIVQVQAMASSAVRGFPVEDTVSISLRFANGALGSFLLSDTAAAPRSWEQTAGENADYARDEREDCYFVSGDRGSLAVPTMRTWQYAGERSWWQPFEIGQLTLEPADPLVRQLSHFCAVIRGETAPLVSGRDALRTLKVTLAIAEAAATVRTITLDGGLE